MISKVEGASSSKKIQRGLVALAVLLLAGALFVGAAGAANSATNPWSLTVDETTYTKYSEIPWGDIKGIPEYIDEDDKVSVTISISGTTKSTDKLVITASTSTIPSISLKNVTISGSIENGAIEITDGKKTKVYDGMSGKETIDDEFDEPVINAVGITATIDPKENNLVKADLTISGSAAAKMKVADFQTYVGDLYKKVFADANTLFGGDNREGPLSATVTVTYEKYIAPGPSGDDDEEDTIIPVTPAESETIEIPEDGEVTFTVEGLATGGVSLGEGVTGTVTVAALPEDLAVPEEWNVLGGAEITTTVVLKDGETATVSMGIPLTALPEGANPADVVMMHFLAATQIWEELKTTFVIEGDNIIYAGETGSFSPFVLVEKVGGSEPVTPPTEEPTTEPTEEPTETPASPGFGILAALAGLGAVALLRRN